MTTLSDSLAMSEQNFYQPLVGPEHAARTYAYGYQYRFYLPEHIFGAYLHSVKTGRTAFILNKLYFDNGYELRLANVAWQPLFDWHLRVMAGEIEPANGETFIRKVWTWRECCTHLLPPPNARWIMPLPGQHN